MVTEAETTPKVIGLEGTPEEIRKRVSKLCFPPNAVGKIHPDYISLTDAIVNQYHPIVHKNNIFLYDCKTGLYSDDDNTISTFITTLATTCDYNGKLSGVISEVKTRVRGTEECKVEGDYPFDNVAAIGFRNGILEFQEDGSVSDLMPFSPKYRLTHKFDVDYNPNVDPKLFEDEIGKFWLSSSTVEELYLPLAASIIQSMPKSQAIKRIWILLGPGNSGKSTYASLLEYVVGKKYIGRLTMHQLCDSGNRFDRYTLIDKTINIGEDISSKKLNDVTIFKAVTGSLYHDVERKGRDKMSAKICCSHLFTANATPSLSADVMTDDAFWNRIEIIKFPNLFENDPTWLSTHFRKEIFESFMLNVIKTVQKYRTGIPKAHPIDETREMWIHYDESPISHFIEEYTVPDYDGMIETKEFRKYLNRWVHAPISDLRERELRNSTPTSAEAISLEVFRLGYRKNRSNVRPNDRQYVFSGMSWNQKIGSLPMAPSEMIESSLSDFDVEIADQPV